MRNALTLALFIMFATTACSGNAGGPGAGLGLLPANVARAGGDLQPDSVPAESSFLRGRYHLYVENSLTKTITIYASTASGNVSPERTIGGPRTGITGTRQAAVDTHGYVYVANYSSVLVFAQNANGNVAPVRVISGPKTTIADAESLAVDSDGTLYVGSFIYNGHGETSILRFAPGANGNVSPTKSSAPLDGGPEGLTLDPHLGLIVSSFSPDLHSYNANVTYVKNLSTYPQHYILSDDPGPLAADPATSTFLAVNGNVNSWSFKDLDFASPTIDRYVDGTTGSYFTPTGAGIDLTPPLASQVSLATCPTAIAIDPTRVIYVAAVSKTHSSSGCTSAEDSVSAFAPNASGAASPLRTIAGPATKLALPQFVTVGP